MKIAFLKSMCFIIVCLVSADQVKETTLAFALTKPSERPFLEVLFQGGGPQIGSNAWAYSLGGISRLAILLDGAKWQDTESALQCGEAGGAILSSSSAMWTALRQEGTIEVVFQLGTNRNKKRQALMTYGPLMTWPAIFVMQDGRSRVTVFYPTKIEPVAWSSSKHALEESRWHSVIVSFSVPLHRIAFSINGEKATSVLNDDFHVRNGFFETLYLGSSGVVPLMTHTVDSFDGLIRTVRIWTNHTLGD